RPPVADRVVLRGLLGEPQRVAQRQYLNAGADLDAFGARGNGTGDRHRRAHYRAARLLVDLGEPDGVEPPAVGGLDLVQRLRKRLCRGLLRPAMEFVVDADLHPLFSTSHVTLQATVISLRPSRQYRFPITP